MKPGCVMMLQVFNKTFAVAQIKGFKMTLFKSSFLYLNPELVPARVENSSCFDPVFIRLIYFLREVVDIPTCGDVHLSMCHRTDFLTEKPRQVWASS